MSSKNESLWYNEEPFCRDEGDTSIIEGAYQPVLVYNIPLIIEKVKEDEQERMFKLLSEWPRYR